MSQGHEMMPSAYDIVIATTHTHQLATDTCIRLRPFLSSWMDDPSLSKELKGSLSFSLVVRPIGEQVEGVRRQKKGDASR